MRALLVLSAAFAALSLGAAVPFEGNTLDCFSLEAKSRQEGRRDFLSDWQAAHNRWGKTKPVPGSNMALKGDGSVTAEPLDNDQAYVTEVEFGTPAQKLKMILDTGSSDVPHWDIELELTAWRGKNPMWMYHKFQATVDTGTSLLFLPDPLASRYWEDVPGVQKSDLLSGVYKFPCEGSQDLPDLLFKLPTEHVIRIPGPYLNYGPLDTEPSLCWAGMQSAKDMAGTVLGDVMLKAVFVAFDVGKNRIGLANKILHDA